MKHFFSILGGMGTSATESFIRVLNRRTPANNDQEYLNYILVNHATVPDRTTYILDHQQKSFLPALLDDVRQQNLLKPDFIVMVCNTAHYFYDELAAASDVPFLNMPAEAVKAVQTKFPQAKRIGVAATRGTIGSGIYQKVIQAAGLTEVVPSPAIQDEIDELIYHQIKQGRGKVNPELYHAILQKMMTQQKADMIILGCTELSLAQELAPTDQFPLVDAQANIADRTLALAAKLQHKPY